MCGTGGIGVLRLRLGVTGVSFSGAAAAATGAGRAGGTYGPEGEDGSGAADTTRSRNSGNERSDSNGPCLVRAARMLLASPSSPSFSERRIAAIAPLTV